MIIIKKNSNNLLSFNFKDNIVLDNPYFIFEFTDIYNRITSKQLINDSSSSRYQQFQFNEPLDISLNANGSYIIYESDISTNIILGGENILDSGEYELIEEIEQDIFFDTEFYDTTQPDLIPRIPESKIIQDASGWLMTDSSWNYVNTLLNSVDASAAALYNVIQDASIYNLNSILANVEASIAYLTNNLGVSKSYVDSSLGLRDTSIAYLASQTGLNPIVASLIFG